MKRVLVLLSFAVLLSGGLYTAIAVKDIGTAKASPTTCTTTTCTWGGQGLPMQEQCDAQNDPFGANAPYIHWVFTAKNITSATVTLGGSGSGSYVMSENGNGSWAVDTPFFDTSSLTATVTFVATGDIGNAQFVISHGCSGATTTTTTSSTTTVTTPGGTTTVTTPGGTTTVTNTVTTPGGTRTVTTPGPTQTVTVPGPTQTVTVTTPGPTTTVTHTVTVKTPGKTKVIVKKKVVVHVRTVRVKPKLPKRPTPAFTK